MKHSTHLLNLKLRLDKLMKKKYNIAIVGASGLVGRTMAKVLEEHDFPVDNIKFLSSKRSAGGEIYFNSVQYLFEELTADSFSNIDFAIFSAGSSVSKEFAPIAVKNGCIVIDNSSFWRMDANVPLVVPEVNPDDLKWHKGIIANPNCSTIQLVVALKPIAKKYGLKRVVCSTYQSISGAGQKGVDKLMAEISGNSSDDKYDIAFSTMFHQFEDNGFTQEENKMVNETRKILNNDSLPLAMTCVRLPILGGHCESVNLELMKEFIVDEIFELFQNSEGIIVVDTPSENEYPTPETVSGKDEVFISRIRKDDSVENGLYLWVVADNLRKGAATNAIQIAEKMIEMKLV